MNWPKKWRTQEECRQHATAEDFQKIFTEEMDSLYLVALLLAGDEAKARQVFVAGLQDAIGSNRIFRDWARSWAKRTIIKNAIAMVRPCAHFDPTHAVVASVAKKLADTAGRSAEVDCVLALEDFERFVFVMAVLERYPDKECSRLLECSLVDVHEARIRALQQLGALKTALLAAHAPTPEETRDQDPIGSSVC